MIYFLLQAVSIAIFGIVTTIWLIEETLISLMMKCFLFMLRVACHPLMIIPTLIAVYYFVHKVWLRRRPPPRQLDSELRTHRPITDLSRTYRSARVGSYRDIGSASSRSFDGCDYREDEMIRSQSNRL